MLTITPDLRERMRWYVEWYILDVTNAARGYYGAPHADIPLSREMTAPFAEAIINHQFQEFEQFEIEIRDSVEYAIEECLELLGKAHNTKISLRDLSAEFKQELIGIFSEAAFNESKHVNDMLLYGCEY